MNRRDQERLQRLREVRHRIALLEKDKEPLPDDASILQQLTQIESQLLAGGSASADWAEHELRWQARLGSLHADILARSSHIMLAFDDMDRTEPEKYEGDAELQELLHWWREEGGRERFLGGIPLEERRALEQKAEEWRRKNP